jgi:predicted RNase H-like HicB family nuclease
MAVGKSILRPLSMNFVIVIEKADDGSYSAYAPDLPGCVACSDSGDEIETSIREAVRLHIESLRTHGDPVPRPSTTTIVVHAD